MDLRRHSLWLGQRVQSTQEGEVKIIGEGRYRGNRLIVGYFGNVFKILMIATEFLFSIFIRINFHSIYNQSGLDQQTYQIIATILILKLDISLTFFYILVFLTQININNMGIVSKPLLFLTFILISFEFTTKLQPNTQHQKPLQLSFPFACPQKFIDLAKAAVITCEKDKLPDTTDCIADEMKKYKLQCWNVLVKTSQDVADIVSYWAPGSCIVKLQNYGQLFNRSYLLWQSLNYNNDANLTQEENTMFLKGQEAQQVMHKYTDEFKTEDKPQQQQLNPQDLQLQLSHLKSINNRLKTPLTSKTPDQLRGDCQQWKVDAVKNIIQYCDLAGNERSGQCIRDRIKDQMSEYWGAYVKTTINSAITIWFAQCYTTVQGYGAYIRYIRVWA